MVDPREAYYRNVKNPFQFSLPSVLKTEFEGESPVRSSIKSMDELTMDQFSKASPGVPIEEARRRIRELEKFRQKVSMEAAARRKAASEKLWYPDYSRASQGVRFSHMKGANPKDRGQTSSIPNVTRATYFRPGNIDVRNKFPEIVTFGGVAGAKSPVIRHEIGHDLYAKTIEAQLRKDPDSNAPYSFYPTLANITSTPESSALAAREDATDLTRAAQDYYFAETTDPKRLAATQALIEAYNKYNKAVKIVKDRGGDWESVPTGWQKPPEHLKGIRNIFMNDPGKKDTRTWFRQALKKPGDKKEYDRKLEAQADVAQLESQKPGMFTGQRGYA